jgi:hypothetical protein
VSCTLPILVIGGVQLFLFECVVGPSRLGQTQQLPNLRITQLQGVSTSRGGGLGAQCGGRDLLTARQGMPCQSQTSRAKQKRGVPKHWSPAQLHAEVISVS